MSEKKIDIIIPTYNAHDTLDRCISSIVCQTIRDLVRVTIVDDCSEKDYQEFIDRYSDILDMQLLRLEENGGPGVARQYGIDNTSCPYFTCIDADDTFYGTFALQMLLRGIEANNGLYIASIGGFLEEHENLQFLNHQADMVWMFGKLYRRSFWEQYDIKFHPTSRANEDNGVNTIIRLCVNPKQQINFLSDIVYVWHEKKDSITRINNCQYSYDQSFVGYAENMAYAIQHAREKNPFNGDISMWTIQCMCHLYTYYMETKVRADSFAKQNWEACVLYYKTVYRPIKDTITKEVLSNIYSEVMKNASQGMSGVAPDITIFQFIEQLEEECSKKKIVEDKDVIEN